MTTPADPVQPVQAGIYTRLTGDATLTALAAVYDEVPEGADYDYVTIRDMLSIPDSSHSTFGRQITATLHTWAQARGNAATNAIGARLYTLLHQQHAALDPLVDGHRVYIVRHEFHQNLEDPQPGIRHRVDRFRIYTQQEET